MTSWPLRGSRWVAAPTHSTLTVDGVERAHVRLDGQRWCVEVDGQPAGWRATMEEARLFAERRAKNSKQAGSKDGQR